MAAGREPNTDGLGLEEVGVVLDADGFVQVNEYLRTSIPHIGAAGDVIGEQMGSQLATPVGAHDGGIVGQNAFSAEPRRALIYDIWLRLALTVIVPYCVLTASSFKACGA